MKIRRTKAVVLAMLMVALLHACGGKEETPAPKPAPAKEAATPIAPDTAQPPQETFDTVRARLRVLGMDGKPIKGMAPIATRQANAFDEPVATGALSNADGLTEFEFPGTEKLYIRAWDPARRFFANNYFDALPNTGNVSDELIIKMAPGASLTAAVQGADGAPLPNTEVQLMLFHPTLGAWWPVQGSTDANGQLTLGPVPPGQFTFKIQSKEGASRDLPATLLPPGETVDLGALLLQ